MSDLHFSNIHLNSEYHPKCMETLMRLGLIKTMNDHLHISEWIIRDFLSEYKILHWSGEYLLENMSKNKGQIERFDVLYNVRWDKNKGMSRGCVHRNQSEQYMLSFRSLADSRWRINPVVIVSTLS